MLRRRRHRTAGDLLDVQQPARFGIVEDLHHVHVVVAPQSLLARLHGPIRRRRIDARKRVLPGNRLDVDTNDLRNAGGRRDQSIEETRIEMLHLFDAVDRKDDETTNAARQPVERGAGIVEGDRAEIPGRLMACEALGERAPFRRGLGTDIDRAARRAIAPQIEDVRGPARTQFDEAVGASARAGKDSGADEVAVDQFLLLN